MDEISDLPQELLSCKDNFELPPEAIVVVVNEEESAMTDQAVYYLLDEILKKKKDLLGPKHRCNRFYPEIRDLLIVQYGLCFNAQTLERKFHYLKRHFDTLCQNKNRGPVSWPFFDKMMEIFAEEMAIEDAPTMASLYPDLPLPKSALPVIPIPQDMKGENVIAESFFKEEEQKPTNGLQQNDTKETVWTHAVVLDFLNECLPMKDALWDPSVRRREVFFEVQNRLKAKGYTFQLETLDRKLKNLKACYHGTVQCMRKKGMRKYGPQRWPYFLQMDELYNGYNEQKMLRKKPGRKAASRCTGGVRRRSSRKPRSKFANNEGESPTNNLDPSTVVKNCDDQPSTSSVKLPRPRRKRCKREPFQQFQLPAPDASPLIFGIEQKIDEACPHSPVDVDGVEEQDELRTDEELKNNRDSGTLVDDITDDFQFAQKMLAFEERRTVATEQLLEQLKESNYIRKRKLGFNKIKLAYLKARAKRKQFTIDIDD